MRGIGLIVWLSVLMSSSARAAAPDSALAEAPHRPRPTASAPT